MTGQKLTDWHLERTKNAWECSTNRGSPVEGFLAQLKGLIDEYLSAWNPSTISVAFPGPITPEGKVLRAPTIVGQAELTDLSLSMLKSRFGRDVKFFLLNDVTAAGYSHAQEQCEDFCIITVSSGIGNKIFHDGEPILGVRGRGGEIGHIKVMAGETVPVCDCGQKGHLGAVASGRGTVAFIRSLSKESESAFRASVLSELSKNSSDLITNAVVAQAFRMNDSFVVGAIKQTTHFLAKEIVTIHSATGIECFILMGGWAKALGERYRLIIADTCASLCWDLGQDWSQMIRISHFGDEVGLIGAGIHATRMLGLAGNRNEDL